MKATNEVIEIGRLTKDPELKYIGTGTAILKFNIAVNKSYKKNDEWVNKVSYFSITVWGKRAEELSKLLNKGQEVLVIGELEQNTWDDTSGNKKSKIIILATLVRLLVSEKKTEENKDDFKDDIPF